MKYTKWVVALGIIVGTLMATTTGHAQVLTPKVGGKAALVVDEQTGQILAAKNIDKRLPIASTSKLLVTYLVEQKLAQHKLSDQAHVKISAGVERLSQKHVLTNVPLSSKRTYTVHELMEDALLPSGNAAAVALGEWATGSVKNTNHAMEQLLSTWHISGVKVYSPAGLTNGDMGDFKQKDVHDNAENVLSARELAIVSRHLMMDYPAVRDITKHAHAVISAPDGHAYPIDNTNKLAEKPTDKFVFTGIKTGSSQASGGNFVGETKVANRPVITIVLGSGKFTDEHQRFADTIAILEQVRNSLQPVTQTSNIKHVSVLSAKAKGGSVDVHDDKPIALFLNKTERKSSVAKEHKYVSSISEPIKKNATLGTVTYKQKNVDFIQDAPTVKLVVNQRTEHANWFTQKWRSLFNKKRFDVKLCN